MKLEDIMLSEMTLRKNKYCTISLTWYIYNSEGFPGGSDSKEFACITGSLGLIPGLGRSLGEGPGSPLQCSCLVNAHGQRSLAGYNPWDCKELDTTEQLRTYNSQTLEWVAIAFSNAWKWKAKVKPLSRVWLLATPWTAAYQALPSMGFSRQEYWSGVPLPSWTSHPAIPPI